MTAATNTQTLILPPGARLTIAAAKGGERPALRCGHILRHGEQTWLCTTDGYMAAGVRLDDSLLDEGVVPHDLLRALEDADERDSQSDDDIAWGRPAGTSAARVEGSWTVGAESYQVRDDVAIIGGLREKLLEATPAIEPCKSVCVDPELLWRGYQAMGVTSGVWLSPGEGPLDPILITSRDDTRRALIMPMRDDSAGLYKAR